MPRVAPRTLTAPLCQGPAVLDATAYRLLPAKGPHLAGHQVLEVKPRVLRAPAKALGVLEGLRELRPAEGFLARREAGKRAAEDESIGGVPQIIL